MNDPHVVALFYRVAHADSVDYSKAKPLVRDEAAFRLEVKDNQARFDMNEHYATEKEARHAVENYIRDWEFSTCLEKGPDSFRLIFERAKIEDRNSIPSVTNLNAIFIAERSTLSTKVTVRVPCYPAPPSGVNFNDPDVQKMYQRYMGYRQGNEPLASMAYFCLSYLEDSTGKNKNRRKTAAQKYQIDGAVLKKIGELSSKKGGQGARKAVGVDNDFTHQERTFLIQAIEKIIRRVAEKAHSSDKNLPKITMSDLPSL